jgi:hypothetical protein
MHDFEVPGMLEKIKLIEKYVPTDDKTRLFLDRLRKKSKGRKEITLSPNDADWLIRLVNDADLAVSWSKSVLRGAPLPWMVPNWWMLASDTAH